MLLGALGNKHDFSGELPLQENKVDLSRKRNKHGIRDPKVHYTAINTPIWILEQAQLNGHTACVQRSRLVHQVKAKIYREPILLPTKT